MYEELQRQFKYYLDNQAEIVERFNGKVVVIKNFEVIGAYETEANAIRETQADGHELGTFIVQAVSPGTDAYTVNISTPFLVNA